MKFKTHKGDHNSMERYDIAIIGTGPAGLSAAVTAAIRKKKILLAGSRDLSSKVQKAQEIQNYLGFPDISGAELGKACQELKASDGERSIVDVIFQKM